MTNHPITPPLELVRQWYQESDRQLAPYYVYMAHRAAQWAADQELEACCEWTQGYAECGDALRLARRPKLPTAKELALHELGDAYDKGKIDDTTYDTIRKALEALPNDWRHTQIHQHTYSAWWHLSDRHDRASTSG